MKKGYLRKQECSVQEVVYHGPLELKLRRVFSAVQFVDTIFFEGIMKVLLSLKEL